MKFLREAYGLQKETDTERNKDIRNKFHIGTLMREATIDYLKDNKIHSSNSDVKSKLFT